MKPLTHVRSRTVVLPHENIDTDRIIPARFLTTTERSGLGKSLFNDWRYRPDGSPDPEFALNRPQARGCEILVAGRNFGCGSSREHAPWALKDFGIRVVIAPSFADIFYGNSFKNGILLITLPQEICDQLMDDAKKGANARLTVDLEAQTITRPDGSTVKFEIDKFRKQALIDGLDEIGLTEQKHKTIDSFEAKNRASQPWLWAQAR